LLKASVSEVAANTTSVPDGFAVVVAPAAVGVVVVAPAAAGGVVVVDELHAPSATASATAPAATSVRLMPVSSD
jgi:hypothetical protein